MAGAERQTSSLIVQVVTYDHGSVLQRKWRGSDGSVNLKIVDAGPLESMRVKAKEVLQGLPRRIAYAERDLTKEAASIEMIKNLQKKP